MTYTTISLIRLEMILTTWKITKFTLWQQTTRTPHLKHKLIFLTGCKVAVILTRRDTSSLWGRTPGPSVSAGGSPRRPRRRSPGEWRAWPGRPRSGPRPSPRGWPPARWAGSLCNKQKNVGQGDDGGGGDVYNCMFRPTTFVCKQITFPSHG